MLMKVSRCTSDYTNDIPLCVLNCRKERDVSMTILVTLCSAFLERGDWGFASGKTCFRELANLYAKFALFLV